MEIVSTIKNIMTKNVVSVRPEMLLSEAAKIIADRGFDGVPVVDDEGKLVGILTEYDLISKGSAIHLPTFQFILQNLEVFKKDKEHFQKDVADIANLKVKDVMNTDPLTLPEETSFEEAVGAFCDHHRVNPIPIIDAERKVVGVLSRYDILKPLRDIG